ncbi:hypothetical protein [Methanoregula sp. PtaB.Bin085]|uniref:hypothetical protein n=1 Tax=Methanoregula sp. PtaB.Bin085 TaxID=1811680 RepID=UPI0025CEAED6|nr:hypothetical protein [Methanoregula sp. PtaB.Bin085]
MSDTMVARVPGSSSLNRSQRTGRAAEPSFFTPSQSYLAISRYAVSVSFSGFQPSLQSAVAAPYRR